MTGEMERIGEEAFAALTARDARTVVSAATIWEVAIKRSLGKLEAPERLLSQLERAGVDLLPVSARHADLVAALPPHHRDPFDRLLVAQATCEELTLVSGDEDIRRYDVEVVW
jgi:PIN domain nuclease of toxin-antitoxin system